MFVDTSGLMCLFDQRDHRHPHAVRHYDLAQSRLSHSSVLVEFVALTIARKAPRQEALRFVESISLDSEIELVWVSRDLHVRAMKLLRERSDKLWSLCDAVSFLLMLERKVLDALTTDHNFEQAGFVRLLAQ